MEIKSINYQTDTGFTLFQKNKNQANLEAIAEEFESMFINQMLKNARDSKLSEALFSSDEEDNFGAMLDQERSRSLALNLDLGIADALLRQFDKKNKE
jgi:flagellar protein FlgJ